MSVQVQFSRFGHNEWETFKSLKEALETIHSGIEENEAAPRLLKMNSTLLTQSGPVTFNTRQIYCMLELIRSK